MGESHLLEYLDGHFHPDQVEILSYMHHVTPRLHDGLRYLLHSKRYLPWELTKHSTNCSLGSLEFVREPESAGAYRQTPFVRPGSTAWCVAQTAGLPRDDALGAAPIHHSARLLETNQTRRRVNCAPTQMTHPSRFPCCLRVLFIFSQCAP